MGDSGSLERGATVLAVPPSLLGEWVRCLVSRGCASAAASRWPVAPAGDEPNFMAYEDLLEAADRGMAGGDNFVEAAGVCESYVVELDSWARMIADLRARIVADAGSIRRATPRRSRSKARTTALPRRSNDSQSPEQQEAR